MSFRTTHRALLAAGLAAALAGCPAERAPINQVQPNALEKRFFVGDDLVGNSDDPEFWAQGTIVDVGYGAAQDGLFTSTYAQPLTRIKWVVQQDLLVARLTYERIATSDGKGAGRASTDGQVVAAYRIQSHFDIRRAYNPSTGEEINVIVENGSDRPWYEREYMRVDWSQNLNTDAYELDTLSQLGLYGGVKYEPLSYYVNDPNHPDAPHFDAESGYLDVTTKAFARPQMIDLSHLGWGIDAFPACMLDYDFMGGGAPTANCNPVELTIRQAFRKVVDNDYEAQDWDGFRFKAYGAFTTDRSGYARNYGMTDEMWHRFINRYNIWKTSHYYANQAARTGPVECFVPGTTAAGGDPHRDADQNGTEDECEAAGAGSRCDVFAQKCTLPFRQREPATVVWYYSAGSNPEYFEGSDWATHDWDVAIRSAIVTARYEECLRTGGDGCADLYPVWSGQMDDNQDALTLSREVDDCRNNRAYAGEDCNAVADRLGAERGYSPGVIALAKMDEAIVLCHSPVEAGDHAACGSKRLPAGLTSAECNQQDLSAEKKAECAKGLWVRPGDLRYHHVNVIQTPQTPSPWGIMVDAHDPLTGEKVSASINAWSHVTDLWTQGVVDLARYIKGELQTADITEGTYVRDWAAVAESAGGGSVGHVTKAERDRRMASFLGISKEKLEESRQLGERLPDVIKSKLVELKAQVQEIRADSSKPSSNKARYEARRNRMKGTDTEAALTTRMMQELAGLTGHESGNELFDRASPFRGNALQVQSEVAKRREIALGERGACIMQEAPAPVAIANLADLLQEKFGNFSRTDSKEVQLARAERMRRYLAQRAHQSVIVHEMGHSIGLRHNFVSSSDAWGYRPQYWQLRTNDGATTEACTELGNGANCVGPRWFDPVTQNERKQLLPMFMQSTVMDYAGETSQDLLTLGAYDFAAARMFYGETVAVHADASYKSSQRRGVGMLDKLDGFGGLVGWKYVVGNGRQTQDIHYSQLQNEYKLIQNCEEVNPDTFKPAVWDETKWGTWHPLLDGLIVEIGGKHTRCRQQPVDYVSWDKLKTGGGKEKAIDRTNRTRVPYGFATDRWADLGNIAVYRHDNGADPYELFDFLITQQEAGHIFDNYRRQRRTFSVRASAERTLSRYNEKIRDGAKGIGLLVNIYKDFSLEIGYNFETLWPYIADLNYADNILASGLAFDHFARQLQRPQSGGHYLADGILRSTADAYSSQTASIQIPNGATGYYGNVSYGGKPLENALADNKGEYDSEYTIWAGSYYDKAYTSMIFTESVDNFISSSRNDFLDARFRAVSLADVFPDGYRRWLSSNLTNDVKLKGARLAANASGTPLKGSDGFPTGPIGWTSWWPESGPEACFPNAQSITCGSTPDNTVSIDPQVGWEQQKFLIAWTLMYLPENEQQHWLNMLGLWEIGADNDPGFANRIEFHDPQGKTYVAKTFGKETIFGQVVQKAPGARMLEYANSLLVKAYETETGPDLDNDGNPDWYEARLFDGLPRVKWDSSITPIGANGAELPNGLPGCNATDNSQCTCAANRACVELSRYSELPSFLRQAMRDYGLADPSMRGIY